MVVFRKTNVLGQDIEASPVIRIDDYELDDVCQFTYLGSTITDNLSLDAEIDKRFGTAASTLARLTVRAWTSPMLSVKTNMAVYNACVISTFLYGSETWTTYAGLERRLNTFHLRSIRHILGTSWQDILTNAGVRSRASFLSMYTLLKPGVHTNDFAPIYRRRAKKLGPASLTTVLFAPVGSHCRRFSERIWSRRS